MNRNNNRKPPERLEDVTIALVAVAMGRESADSVIKNTRLVNVNTGEIQENTDIAIKNGRIALVGDATHTIGKNTRVTDADGMYAAPGFMDGHLHIESSMVRVREFARVVIPHGTTAIFPDPHEIANVLGVRGVKFMAEDAVSTPLRVFTMAPSCVPSQSDFEDGGAALGVDDIASLMERDDIYGLGEVMNFTGVKNGDKDLHKEMAVTAAKNKIITGHYAMPETGAGLNAYVAAGARCCHESERREDAIAKMRLGMYVQIREGSAWRNVHEVIKAITERRVDSRFATLVSDDVHPDTLLTLGHMDHIVRRVIEEGVDPITAIQMATINTAQCYQMDRDLGSVSPGKCADIILLSDLAKVKVKKVFIDGEPVADNNRLLISIEQVAVPDAVRNTCRVKGSIYERDLLIQAPDGASGKVATRVIEVVESRAATTAREIDMNIEDGFVPANVEKDIAKLVVIERHKASGVMGKGFVKGFHIKSGAVASTVSHDAHNLIILGTNDRDMALAGNSLLDYEGGIVVVEDGEILSNLPLPIAGLMSGDPALIVADFVLSLDEAWKDIGCAMESPFMAMTLLSLSVIPELRLTNRGLVDVVNGRFTSLFV
ncbi:adenine deaminase [Synergistales bacterium]|nr:adenine deaminase [Synergistales bacterium]